MSGRILFPAGKEEVLVVPKGAIVHIGGSDGLFTVTPDNVARLVMIRTGRSFGDDVEVLSGLDPGARVAVSPVDRLADGMRVEIRK
jgi:multidrug efflux pump subunit AcrA (membrane-fusion protein)